MDYKYLMNGRSLVIDEAKCFGCGMCLEVCPHNVFLMEDGKAFINNRDFCMECGACKMNCPVGAINVNVGVGCAAAIINGILHRTVPDCGCSSGDKKENACCG